MTQIDFLIEQGYRIYDFGKMNITDSVKKYFSNRLVSDVMYNPEIKLTLVKDAKSKDGVQECEQAVV